MSMIKVENLTFAYPGSYENVFDHCSFQIDSDWKLGFVGRNGRGKTTLLRLLQNQYEYSGTITSSLEFDYFPCPVPGPDRFTLEVLESICPSAQEWEFLRELSYLEVKDEVLWRPFETLSGGEQTKVLLAAHFLKEGHFPLIDEPTNHLDTAGRKLLSRYLNRKKGFILVSHDRRFLDGCVDHILSLNRATIDVQSGNFSSWLENFNRQQSFEQVQNQKLQRDIRRLSQAAARTSTWSGRTEASKYGNGPVDRGFIGHKSAKMMKRAKTIEARRTKAVEEKSSLLKNTETAERLMICPLTHHSQVLAAFHQVSPVYGEHPVCPPVSFEIWQGERILLEGQNGSGKSSLLKLLTGQLSPGASGNASPQSETRHGLTLRRTPEVPEYTAATLPEGTLHGLIPRRMPEDLGHTGTLSLASGLQISYVPQDTSFLRGALSRFASDQGLDDTLFRAILRKLDFERSAFDTPMEHYSAGQKKKVLLARSLCQRAHLYVWDEPLNYIDIYSRMQIEQLLLEFEPTMIFVEHDQAFQDLVATKKVKV